MQQNCAKPSSLCIKMPLLFIVFVVWVITSFNSWVMHAKQSLLLGLVYKSRVFSRKLRPGELWHGHNSSNSQQILMGLRGTLPISLDRVYPSTLDYRVFSTATPGCDPFLICFLFGSLNFWREDSNHSYEYDCFKGPWGSHCDSI